MKKTTALSLVTAAAAITTSVGTFTAYDILTANNAGNGATLDFGSPVTVVMNMDTALPTSALWAKKSPWPSTWPVPTARSW